MYEIYFGGKKRHKHESQMLNAGRCTVGKVAAIRAKNGDSNKVTSKVMEGTEKQNLQEFVDNNARPSSVVYTDTAKVYNDLSKDYHHESVNHSSDENVNEQAHISGMESIWSTLKCAHKGTLHKFIPKYLRLYVDEFSGRDNIHSLLTIKRMESINRSMEGKRLTYKNSIADSGLDSGAR